jgi:hypothetical protein
MRAEPDDGGDADDQERGPSRFAWVLSGPIDEGGHGKDRSTAAECAERQTDEEPEWRRQQAT